MDTRLFYNSVKGERYNLPMLTLHGFITESENIHNLTYSLPYYDPLTQYVIDSNTVDGPNKYSEYSVNYEVKDLPLDVALPNLKTSMKETVTSTRWGYETGGITNADGSRILTTLDDQNRIASALMGVQAAEGTGTPLTTVDFKGPTGWVTIPVEYLKVIASTIAHHVQGCFTREKELHQAIDACKTVEEIRAIKIDAGWPQQIERDENGYPIRPERERPIPPEVKE